ncbi:hypothetical protein JI750_11625 [Flavobacterium sp. GN10]|uniref:Uncharacterized protein n=1 Tax=Flavobacterium tagetis TaxID=2801336 RepID=A0ABS1KDZ2_9FLAO|nr:hypothetical protein [Flavobacterium tagetis]MBL0737543.1 hypothetical protein [Flavobacterium tagetis]
MNILQKTLGAIFPPYKYNIIRKEQGILFNAIIDALPEELTEIKIQTKSGSLFDLANWKLYPDFKNTIMWYAGETYLKCKKRGKNFKLSGLKIFSDKNNSFENIELLIQDNLLIGLKITNSNYQLDEFKLSSIDNQNFEILNFDFPPNGIDLFYDNLDSNIKERLNYNELFDIDFNGRIFYAFYDLEDGNYLAVDKKQNVYSLIHDAKPMASKMKITFLEILEQIENKQFDINAHFDDRYSK